MKACLWTFHPANIDTAYQSSFLFGVSDQFMDLPGKMHLTDTYFENTPA